jgi:hypothetical protein
MQPTKGAEEPVEKHELVPGPVPLPSALRQFIESTSKIVTSIISLVSVAYLFGYIEQRAYFNAFGASWLLDEVPLQKLVLHNVVGIALICSGFVFAVLFVLAGKDVLGRWFSLQWFTMYVLLEIGVWFDGKSNAVEWGRHILFTAEFLICSLFYYVILQYMTTKVLFDKVRFMMGIFLVLTCLIGLPAYVGDNRGKVDNSKASTLPIVTLKNVDTGLFRLVLISGGHMWCAKLDATGGRPSVFPVNASDIVSITETIPPPARLDD